MKNLRKLTAAALIAMAAPAAALAQQAGDGTQPIDEYKALLTKLDRLNRNNEALERKIARQEALMEQQRADLASIDELKPRVQALVLEMANDYAELVENDVPFAPLERSQRVLRYQEAVGAEDADKNIAQNFRLLLEALQIEMDAGRTVARETEVYVDESGEPVLDEDGNQELTEFLRVGRIAYIRVNEKRGIFDAWNQRTREWEPLPATYKPDVNFGLKIAKEQTAPDVFFVPVLAPEGQ